MLPVLKQLAIGVQCIHEVQIGRTASAWCELMAVEMALFKTAFEDCQPAFLHLDDLG